MPTPFTAAARIDGNTDQIGLGSAADIDNLTAFTLIALLRADGAVNASAFVNKGAGSSTGWRVAIQQSGRVDCGWTRATTNAQSLHAGGMAMDNSWRWLVVRGDQSNGTNVFSVRAGAYGGALSNITASGVSVGSGAWSDDSAANATLGYTGTQSPNRNLEVAFVGLWAGALSDGTIDAYCADMADDGITDSIDAIHWTPAMTGSATSAKGVFTGSYSGIVLVDGPDPAVPSGPTPAAIAYYRRQLGGLTD